MTVVPSLAGSPRSSSGSSYATWSAPCGSSTTSSRQGRGADGSSAFEARAGNTRAGPRKWTLRLVLDGGSPQYELIEPQQGPSIHADWLAERGEGFHHVAYVVASLDLTTAEMEAAGHSTVARIHSFAADGDGAAAYFDTA